MVPPDGLEKIEAVQVNVLPLRVELSAMLVAVALQIVCGEADPDGLGLTVTLTVKEFPTQPFAEGVTVYSTTPAEVPVLVSV